MIGRTLGCLLAVLVATGSLAAPVHASGLAPTHPSTFDMSAARSAAKVTTCSDSPPYDCTRKQMWRDARRRTVYYVRHAGFGHAGRAGILKHLDRWQRKRVVRAFRAEVRDHLQARAQPLLWRGHTYRDAAFPVKRYVRVWAGAHHPARGSSAGMRRTTGTVIPSCLFPDRKVGIYKTAANRIRYMWAHQWCKYVPARWKPWRALARSLALPRPQTRLDCKAEIIVGIGAGAWGAWAGARYVTGTLLTKMQVGKAGGAGAGTGLIECVGRYIGRMAEW